MLREEFKDWLGNKYPKKTTSSRCSNAAKVDKSYDLDKCFCDDGGLELIEIFDNAIKQAKEGYDPEIDIEIVGDYVTGLSTLRYAASLYFEFKRSAEYKTISKKLSVKTMCHNQNDVDDKDKENSGYSGIARYIGDENGFNTYIKAGFRNKVNAWAKPERDLHSGICEYCGKKAELQSAHRHGKEFKDIVKQILQNNYKIGKDLYDVNLYEFEKIFRKEHHPIKNIFFFLCPDCHTAYDKTKTITDAMIEKKRINK